MSLRGKIIDVHNLSNENKLEMFKLMETFYENMNLDIFISDLNNKDSCIMLFDERGIIQGFSTQKLIKFNVNNKEIKGVFSGDTIIHRDHWGSMELYKEFGKKYVNLSKNYNELYWFLISKGYKTYRILPSFFYEFYPSCLRVTPLEIKNIMNCFGNKYYPEEYNSSTGVIEYKKIKDKLKPGVADITEDKLNNKHIRFFKDSNPNYIKGNDMVCLASLNPNNLKPIIKRLILGG